MNSTSLLSHDPTEQEIQHVAYQLWQEQGKPAGQDLEIWLAAKESLRHRATTPAKHRSPNRAQTPPKNAQAAAVRRR